MGSVAPRIVNHASYVTRINFEIILRFFSWQAQIFGDVGGRVTLVIFEKPHNRHKEVTHNGFEVQSSF